MNVNTIPQHSGESIEIPLGKAKFYFKRLRWATEINIEAIKDGVERMNQTLALALTNVDSYQVSFEEAKIIVDNIPRTIRERVYKIYLSVTGAERRFTTVPVYKAPELDDELPPEIEEKSDEEIDYEAFHEALEESIEAQRQIINNRPQLEPIPSTDDEDEDAD